MHFRVAVVRQCFLVPVVQQKLLPFHCTGRIAIPTSTNLYDLSI